MKSQNFVIFPLCCVLLMCVHSINSQLPLECSTGCQPIPSDGIITTCSNGLPALLEGTCECCPPDPSVPGVPPSSDGSFSFPIS
ncbi:Hypothetical protein CINCED_3A004271 [Cinara cedri]|uniref:Uncharacterized protein n=1 Tax=Cinara cedri TaxID=506608 RepID=A0A5E4NMX4_9HEMI|nr:Hypothetical protein CINCED_3A004271 [Cinara cedri]